jgi:NAD(P)-dependent dehydrogenase (short-subunit alcohol dehydrogenase family)
MAPNPWVLTTPSSRGIGFALTRHLLRTTTLPIVATARSSPSSLQKSLLADLPSVDPSRLEVLTLDVTNESSVQDAAAHCKEKFPSSNGSYLHLALCIPGILHPEKSPQQINYDAALQTFKINALGPLLLMKHFTPFLPKKATTLAAGDTLQGLNSRAIFAIMSARVGSISDNGRGGWYSYRSSKAAVNQTVKSLDIYLRTSAGGKAIAVGLHPGTVKTGLSEEFWKSTPKDKLFSKEFSAERLCEVLKGLDGEKGDGGKCWDWEGKEIPP